MRRARRWIAINWFWLCAGIILTIVFTRYEFGARGSFEIGGEWLTVPLMLIAGKIVRRVRHELRICHE